MQNYRKYTVQKTACENSCSDRTLSEQLIELDVVYTAIQRRDCLNSCLYSHSSEKRWIICNNELLIISSRLLLGAFCWFVMAVILSGIFLWSCFRYQDTSAKMDVFISLRMQYDGDTQFFLKRKGIGNLFWRYLSPPVLICGEIYSCFSWATSEMTPHPTNGTPNLIHLLVIRLSPSLLWTFFIFSEFFCFDGST